jgi:hypothetical protein
VVEPPKIVEKAVEP